jgi:hypothetical protein
MSVKVDYGMPSFFVLGVQKAGTSSLHRWLSMQPDVCLPKLKETHFFSHPERFEQGLEWYRAQFPAGQEGGVGVHVLGEVDPEYCYVKEAAQRIRESIKKPKFIFVFREPIARAYSHYLMTVRRGFESLSFAEALTAEKERERKEDRRSFDSYYSYSARGRYAEQVARFRRLFPEASFHYVTYDELFDRDSSYEAFSRICRFVGLESIPVAPDLSEKANQASRPRSRFIRDLIYKRSWPRKAVGSLLLSSDLKLRIAIALDRWNQEPMQKQPVILERMPESILAAFREEVISLESETGLRLDHWKNIQEID